MRAGGKEAGGISSGTIGLIGQACTAVIDTVSAGVSYHYQMQILNTQFKMQKSQLQFQEDTAAVQRDAGVASAQFQIDSIKVQQEGQEANLKSVERRKKCEDELIIQKSIKREHDATKKVAKARFSKESIRRIFNDQRASYSHGKPARASSVRAA